MSKVKLWPLNYAPEARRHSTSRDISSVPENISQEFPRTAPPVNSRPFTEWKPLSVSVHTWKCQSVRTAITMAVVVLPRPLWQLKTKAVRQSSARAPFIAFRSWSKSWRWNTKSTKWEERPLRTHKSRGCMCSTTHTSFSERFSLPVSTKLNYKPWVLTGDCTKTTLWV